MKALLLLTGLLAGGSFAEGQPAPDTLWTKTLRIPGFHQPSDICEAADGSFRMRMRTGHGVGWASEDVGIVKLSASGDTVWCKKKLILVFLMVQAL